MKTYCFCQMSLDVNSHLFEDPCQRNLQKEKCQYMALQKSFISVQSLSRVRLFVTSWIAARQASLSITKSRSSLRLMSIESVMPSSHLILCRTLFRRVNSLVIRKIQIKTIYMLIDACYEIILVPVRIAGNWKTDHTKCWQGYGYSTLLHSWWES